MLLNVWLNVDNCFTVLKHLYSNFENTGLHDWPITGKDDGYMYMVC